MFLSKDFFSKIRLALIRGLLGLLVATRSGLKFFGRAVAQGAIFIFRPVAGVGLFFLRPLVRSYWRVMRILRETGRAASHYVPYIVTVLLLMFGMIGNIFAQEEKSVEQTSSHMFDVLAPNENTDILITEEGIVLPEKEAATRYITSDGTARADVVEPEAAKGVISFNLPTNSIFGDEYARPGFGNAENNTRSVEQYVVRSGDTVSSIAEQFGISIYTILWANKLNLNSTLKPGQTIDILPTSGVAHRVQAGDTVQSLAKKYNSNADDIISFNHLAFNQNLSPGNIIIIPGGEIVAPPTPPPAPAIAPTIREVFVPNQVIKPSTGKLLWPVPLSHRITQYYGPKHTGIDIAADYLTPIVAADDGIIELVQFGRTGYGYQTIIDHENGYRTRYGHQSQIFVKPGDHVTRGQTIGTVGSTGQSTGPHLHFEVYVNGRRTNPLPYVR